MQVVIEKIEKPETLDDLKDLIRQLRVENGANDDTIADALNRLKVKPENWTAFRVSCLVRGFKLYKKWGRKSAAEEAARFAEKQSASENGAKPKRKKCRRKRLATNVVVDDCSTANTYAEAM